MAIHLGRPLPDASVDRPGRRPQTPPAGSLVLYGHSPGPPAPQVPAAGSPAPLWGPPGLRPAVTADHAGTLRLPATARAGVYRLEVLDRPDRFFAVNLLDRQESHIEPLPSVQLTGRVVEAQQSLVQKANVPVWPGFILRALLLVVVEWIVYNAKMRI